jgi:hypothetical protein
MVAGVGGVVSGGTVAGAAGGGITCGEGGSAQPSVMPRIAATTLPNRQRASKHRLRRGQPLGMWIIVLEMLAALGVLLFIVWWTMFAGRRRGERRDDEHEGQ